jgi:hypothetical protein
MPETPIYTPRGIWKNVKKRVDELIPGDLVELLGDKYADPDRDHPGYELEWAHVLKVEAEAPDVSRVDFVDGESVGFPPEHKLPWLHNANLED